MCVLSNNDQPQDQQIAKIYKLKNCLQYQKVQTTFIVSNAMRKVMVIKLHDQMRHFTLDQGWATDDPRIIFHWSFLHFQITL